MKPELTSDPVVSAQAADLRYVNDSMPGIIRKRAGKGFSYIGPDGRPIRNPAERRRIKALAIPPAWTDVWICTSPRGHIQATGRDARGRKQYRYHPRWRETRDETKFARMLTFAEALPHIRRRVEEDLVRPGLPRERVLATVVRLLEATLIRVGNDEYARANHSFGLTTMRDQHVDVNGSSVHFHFNGKGGKEHEVDVQDRRLARIVKRCQDIPGQELFQYVDENGERQPIDSGDVNDYLREITGERFTAKDFRTWVGTVAAAQALQELGACDSEAQVKAHIVCAVEVVAKRLGNTAAICRKSYIHPAVIDAYIDGTLLHALQPHANVEEDLRASLEAAVLMLLRQRRTEQVRELDT